MHPFGVEVFGGWGNEWINALSTISKKVAAAQLCRPLCQGNFGQTCLHQTPAVTSSHLYCLCFKFMYSIAVCNIAVVF